MLEQKWVVLDLAEFPCKHVLLFHLVSCPFEALLSDGNSLTMEIEFKSCAL